METFLNSSIETNDDRISIDGYNLIRADHPSDSKRGGVCIYYREHISLIKRDDICTLDNCLVTEIRWQVDQWLKGGRYIGLEILAELMSIGFSIPKFSVDVENHG